LSTRKIPILIIVDAEPDARQLVPGQTIPWSGFERFCALISSRRAALRDRTGAPATFSWFWRMDRQIELTYGAADWAVRSYAGQVADLNRQGDEAGLHVHAFRWDAGPGRWIADHGNRPWVESCVRDAFIAFERAFGRPCRLIRFGDGWLDNAAVDLIERLGAYIDLTLEPGGEAKPGLVAEELSTGSLPDRRNVPKRPYRPCARDFRKPDRNRQNRLWMLPVSTDQLACDATAARRPLDNQSWMAVPGYSTIQLNLGIEPGQFAPIFDRNVSARHRPYAAICVRTDVGSNEHLTACIEQNLATILNHRLADRFLFTGPSQALALLTN
jgi:hypothetical protein